jgi:hypothetical protein
MSAAQSVIDGLRANREKLEAFCGSLSEEELNRLVPPDNAWTVKDFIIHLIAFDDLTTDWVESVIGGNLDGPAANPDGSKFDVDEWNERRLQECRGKPLAQLMADWRPERERFLDALAKLSEDDMKKSVFFPGDNKRDGGQVPFGLFLHGLVRHDPIHVADILKGLPARAQDPDTAAWIDDRMVHWYQQAMAGPAKR